MNNLLILAHPERDSFQGALFGEVAEHLIAAGEPVERSDLYGESFPPVLPAEEIARGGTAESPVLRHQRLLRESDRVLFFYPDWWGMPPALLKGWLDRVLAAETAYRWEGEDFLEKSWVPLLKGKSMILFISADGALDEAWLRGLWEERVFGPCGASVSLRILDRIRERSFGEIRDWAEEQKKSL